MLAAPLPLSWESPKSILLRCAHANFFARIPHSLGSKVEEMNSAISMLCGDHFSVKDMVRNIREAYQSVTIDYAPHFYKQLSGITEESPFEVRGIQVPYSELETVKHRVCADCFSDHGHSKIFADLKAFTACPVHESQYLEVSPCCQKALKWNRVRLDKCYHCGAQAFEAKSMPGKVPEEIELHSMMVSGQLEKVAEVLELLSHLRRCFDDEVMRTGQVLGVALDFAFARTESLVRRLMQIYENGEYLPIRLLLSCLCINTNPQVSQKAKLIASTTGKGAVTKPWTGTRQPWFRLEQVQVGLSVSANTVRKMVREGHLSMQENESGLSVIPVADVAQLIRWVDAEFAKPSRQAGKVLSGINAQNVLVNLKALEEGRVVVCGVDWREGLKGLLFAKTKHKSPDAKRKVAWLDVNDFAKHLNTYPDAVRRACHSGFISKKDIIANGGIKYGFTAEFAEIFAKKYCFLSEISQKLGGRRRTVLSAILTAKGINPVSGPEIDGALVPVYLRDDLAGLDFIELIESPEFESKAGRKKAGEVLYDKSKWVSTKEAKKVLKINDQEIVTLVNMGCLKVSIPPGRERDNFKYFSLESVKRTGEFLGGAIPTKQVWDEVGISKKEFYLRFVDSGLVNVVSVGRRVLVSKEQADIVREDCRRFVSLRIAEILSGAPSKHFTNLVRTERIRKVSCKETPSAKHIDLIPRSMVEHYATERHTKSIM